MQINNNPRRAGKLTEYYESMTEEQLKRVITNGENSLKVAREVYNKKRQVKFIMIVPKRIRDYMDWKAERTGLHKAEIVRRAVNKKISSDTDYKRLSHLQ